jgi:hypothetical protein
MASDSPCVSALDGNHHFTNSFNNVRIKRIKTTLQNNDEVVE